MQIGNDFHDLADARSADLRRQKGTLPLLLAAHADRPALEEAARACDADRLAKLLADNGAQSAVQDVVERLVGETFAFIEDLALDRWNRAKVRDSIIATTSGPQTV